MKSIQRSQEHGLKDFPKGMTTGNKYDDIGSKYLKETDTYVPTFLSKYEKKPQKLPRYNIKKKESVSPKLNTKELDRTLVKTLGNSKEIV